MVDDSVVPISASAPGESLQRESPGSASVKLSVRNLTISYEGKPVLSNVNLEIRENEIFGIIGPAGAGKTSFLKCLNRMDLFAPEMQVTGEIVLDGVDVLKMRNVYELRRRIGVVFPLPVGLPLSVYDNVALAPRLAGIKNRRQLDVIVEQCLQRAALWEEVKNRLNSLGSLLSGGQQQRLTIARALSQEPDLLCLDEFSIAVDPVTTMRIEDVLREIQGETTIILVTNLVQQARRLAARTAFFHEGSCVEVNDTEEMFTGTVRDQRTRDYVDGRFG